LEEDWRLLTRSTSGSRRVLTSLASSECGPPPLEGQLFQAHGPPPFGDDACLADTPLFLATSDGSGGDFTTSSQSAIRLCPWTPRSARPVFNETFLLLLRFSRDFS